MDLFLSLDLNLHHPQEPPGTKQRVRCLVALSQPEVYTIAAHHEHVGGHVDLNSNQEKLNIGVRRNSKWRGSVHNLNSLNIVAILQPCINIAKVAEQRNSRPPAILNSPVEVLGGAIAASEMFSSFKMTSEMFSSFKPAWSLHNCGTSWARGRPCRPEFQPGKA